MTTPDDPTDFEGHQPQDVPADVPDAEAADTPRPGAHGEDSSDERGDTPVADEDTLAEKAVPEEVTPEEVTPEEVVVDEAVLDQEGTEEAVVLEEFALDEGPEDVADVEVGAAPVEGAAKWAWRLSLGLMILATVVAGLLAARQVAGPVGDVAVEITDFAADVGTGAWDQWVEWGATLQGVATEIPERQIEAQRQLAGSDSLLLIVVDDAGRGLSFGLLTNADEADATLSLLPPSLFAILPGYGDFNLSDAMIFEGPELASLTVSNVLGIRIDETVVIGPGQLAGSLDDPIQVDLPIPLIVDQGNGSQVVVAQAGPQLRAPDQAETIMVTAGIGTELEWMQRQAAVWDGFLAAIGSDPDVAPRLGALTIDPQAVTGALAASAASAPNVTLLPVSRVAVAGADEGFKVDAAAAADFVVERMPHVILRAGERPRVEILNGNGRVGTTRAVAESLVRRGFRVINTDNADNFDFDTSLVISQGRENRVFADEVLGILGTGDIQLELRAPSGVVDLSIIVGHDIPAGEG
ncbi:MAG: LytR C-terminal domain-containing protein [Acidimicrobiia bacterium]|nr:LytR C-terminal domain-containing protein [Acidimicrobiia bacterium]